MSEPINPYLDQHLATMRELERCSQFHTEMAEKSMKRAKWALLPLGLALLGFLALIHPAALAFTYLAWAVIIVQWFRGKDDRRAQREHKQVCPLRYLDKR